MVKWLLTTESTRYFTSRELFSFVRQIEETAWENDGSVRVEVAYRQASIVFNGYLFSPNRPLRLANIYEVSYHGIEGATA